MTKKEETLIKKMFEKKIEALGKNCEDVMLVALSESKLLPGLADLLSTGQQLLELEVARRRAKKDDKKSGE